MGKFASRAGEKLEFALDEFGISVEGLVVADFGCSTGGFVDCLLQRGVKRVYAVDTGYGVLDWKLRNDSRVVVMERVNAMHVELPERMDLISVDVGWTRQKNILGNVFVNLGKEGVVISLIKPHYEAEKRYLRKGKLLEERIGEVLEKVKRDIEEVGGLERVVESPILGGNEGNKEFLGLVRERSF